MYDAIIVGAGVAGLTAARDLVRAGWQVLVLEKSRGFGGRAATRTLHGNRVDHGAQYFTARSDAFLAQVERWLEQDQVHIWQRGFHTFNENGLQAPHEGHPRYIFPKGMNTIGKLLADTLNVQRETKVLSVAPSGQGWTLTTDTDETFETHYVILNAPAEQARALCQFDLKLSVKNALEKVVMQPCFALIAGFPRELQPEWAGLNVALDNSFLAWLAQDSSKREHPEHTVLVMHSSHSFAQTHFAEPLETVETLMRQALKRLDKRFGEPLWTNMQRWRYAQVTQEHRQRFLQHDSLFFCGDWCGGNKLEAAYLSGLAVAQTLAPTGKTTTR